jgi:hypothetical protein
LKAKATAAEIVVLIQHGFIVVSPCASVEIAPFGLENKNANPENENVRANEGLLEQ